MTGGGGLVAAAPATSLRLLTTCNLRRFCAQLSTAINSNGARLIVTRKSVTLAQKFTG